MVDTDGIKASGLTPQGNNNNILIPYALASIYRISGDNFLLVYYRHRAKVQRHFDYT